MIRLTAVALAAIGLWWVGGVAWGGELPPGGTFFDDDGNVHEQNLEALAAEGILRGCNPPDLACPDDPLTRAQLAALLVRALELGAGDHPGFSDVPTGSIFDGDIRRLAAARITRGCGPDRFCPNRAVTRAEVAAFLVRAFELPPSDRDHFTDDDGSIFAGDIDRLAAARITTGCNPPANDRFCPADPLTRAQFASLLARALGLAPIEVAPRPSFEVAVTGDILIHSPLMSRAAAYGSATGQPFDFRPMFSEVRPILSDADLTLCHLEVPLSADNTGLNSYPSFNAPREVAQAIAWAGYEGCSTASNHSLDQGTRGVVETLDVLDAYGVGHTGTARSAAEAATPRLYPVGEATVAHLSYSYWFNGLRRPADKPWLANRIDAGDILAEASRAREAGADLVLVSLHWGEEYRTWPSSTQTRLARELLRSPDVDVIVGHHAHVVQPIGMVGDEYVVYGLGNFLSNQCCTSTQDGVIVHLEVARRAEGWWVVRDVASTPTWVYRTGGYRILPVSEFWDDRGLGSTLRSSWSRTSWAIESLGTPGLEVR